MHFFWGSFDLAVTRSPGGSATSPGRRAGLSNAVVQEAYSHEVSSAGFWPGNDGFPAAAFYSYAYPEPQGYRLRPVTDGARFDSVLGEFILPYETVRRSAHAETIVLEFLSSTYEAAADAGNGIVRRWMRPRRTLQSAADCCELATRECQSSIALSSDKLGEESSSSAIVTSIDSTE